MRVWTGCSMIRALTEMASAGCNIDGAFEEVFVRGQVVGGLGSLKFDAKREKCTCLITTVQLYFREPSCLRRPVGCLCVGVKQRCGIRTGSVRHSVEYLVALLLRSRGKRRVESVLNRHSFCSERCVAGGAIVFYLVRTVGSSASSCAWWLGGRDVGCIL